MKIKSQIAGLLMAASVIGAFGYLLITIKSDLRVQQARIEQQIDFTQRQLERIESLILRLEGTAAQSPMLEAGPGSVTDIDQRPPQFPLQPRQPWIPDTDSLKGFPERQVSSEGAANWQVLASEGPRQRLPLAEAFEADTGASDWSKAMAADIARAYETEPFFERFNGVLLTDCKKATCLVAWTLPVVDPSDPELAMAEYELMALSAQKEHSVRRMQSQRRIENGRTIIELYVSR